MVEFAFLHDDTVTKIEELNDMKCLSVIQGPPSVKFNNLEYETDDGERETNNNTFNPFDLTVRFLLLYDNIYDYSIKQAEFYAFLMRRKSFYIMHEFMPGKRYPVQVEGIEVEEQLLDGAVYEVTFKAFKAHSESIESTLCEQDMTTQNWQFSQGLVAKEYQYSFKKNNFIITNLGDFTIDPRRKHYLKITLKGQSDGTVTIVNKTTGDKFVFNKPLNSKRGEVITIESVYPFKDGIHCGIDTNGELITLVPGDNEIQIRNVSAVDVSFDFRFLYKV